MGFKKGIFIIVLMFLVSAFGFSQVVGFGLLGTYNPYNPSFWDVGYMMNATGDYAGRSAHFFRIGMTFGQATLSYEKKNPFALREMKEYWQRSFSYDFIIGYAWQINLIDSLALRLGADNYMAMSNAYVYTDSDAFFNVGLTGIAGLTLFPKGKFFVNLDACPGFTLNPAKTGIEVFAFILPIRLTAGINIGGDVKKSTPRLTTNEEGFQYRNTRTNNKPSIEIQGYKGTGKHLVIPETINGRPVTEIGNLAFSKMGLESVSIPASVRIIGRGAFSGNKLTGVTIPSSVLYISKGAFEGNNISFPNVEIPERLEPFMDEIFDPFPQLIVMNQLAVPVVHLYLSPAGENTWEDILSEPIRSGNGHGTDWIYRISYDIRAEDINGNTYTILNQDFSVTDGSVGKMFPITPSRKDN